MHVVAVREERFPDDLVGDVRAVAVGRVDVVDAQLDCGPQHLDRGRAVARRPEDAGAGELHRAVADPVEVEVPNPVEAWAAGRLVVVMVSLRTRRPYRSAAGAATADVKSGSTPSWANMVATPMWQLNSWILPSRTYQKSAVGMSSLAPVGWITPAGVSNGPRKVPGSTARSQRRPQAR